MLTRTHEGSAPSHADNLYIACEPSRRDLRPLHEMIVARACGRKIKPSLWRVTADMRPHFADHARSHLLPKQSRAVRYRIGVRIYAVA